MGVIKGRPAAPTTSTKPVTGKATPLVVKQPQKARPLDNQNLGVKASDIEPTKGPNKDVVPKQLRPGGI